MTTPSLFEDCQAWIEKGHESWKSYFTKWETFAKCEEHLPESELLQNLTCGHSKRKNGNKKILMQPFSQRTLKTVVFRNQKKRQKKSLKKKKKCTSEIGSRMLFENSSNENLTETENKQLEITLTEVFSNFSKANTNICETFAVVFQIFSGREMAIKDYLIPKQNDLPHGHFDVNTFGLPLKNQQVLLSPSWRNSFYDRSICPPRGIYLQDLSENLKEIHLEQKQSKSLRIGAQGISNLGAFNFKSHHNNQQFLALSDIQTPNLRQNLVEVNTNLILTPAVPRFNNNMALKPIAFDSIHTFPRSFCQSKKHFKNVTTSKANFAQEDKRVGHICLQQRTNLSSDVDNAYYMPTPQRQSPQQRYLTKSISPRMHPSKPLVFDRKEDDSDSDDQAVYRSPLIRRSSKRLKIDEQGIDADDCQSVFDRILKPQFKSEEVFTKRKTSRGTVTHM